MAEEAFKGCQIDIVFAVPTSVMEVLLFAAQNFDILKHAILIQDLDDEIPLLLENSSILCFDLN